MKEWGALLLMFTPFAFLIAVVYGLSCLFLMTCPACRLRMSRWATRCPSCTTVV